MGVTRFRTLSQAREHLPGRLVDTAVGQLHVRVSGDGCDVLPIHGVTDNGATWDRVAPTLARADAAHVRTPVHVVHGDSDHVIPPRIGQALAAAIAGARLTAHARGDRHRDRARLRAGADGVPAERAEATWPEPPRARVGTQG